MDIDIIIESRDHTFDIGIIIPDIIILVPSLTMFILAKYYI